ncbi:MBL fold metallo-hydrolase RNA specificity domain-containing protein [Nocardioides sp.]|uniref:MBL fold metallo-hydrolase RNA specificity domain-containing protein n=1 Tax=Nocardioides sp. TaxID=35761 RepID=UPI002736A16E|nr:MBL fold metallo-hydrolase [Nocardioides sp.]MDP3894757.1 MBL fold metallo-hydrolase [Nocardioides sp.]
MGGHTSVTFLGAARTVTGSKFLVDTDGARVMVDCGLFQGERLWRRRNWEQLSVDPATVDAVVITHAHLDHSGYLPLLVKNGFSGPAYCTPETAELAAIILRDSAHIAEGDAAHADAAGYSKHQPALPLFDSGDAEKAIDLLTTVDHNTPTTIAGGIGLELRSAGHILGSAFAELELAGHRLLVSGDIGRPGHPLLLPPETPHAADTVVVESTYGNRQHRPEDDDVVADAITRTVERGGVVLMPAFAVDRTFVLLMVLARLETEGRIPSVPVYVDSPMALRALEVYQRAIARHDPQVRPEVTMASTEYRPARLRLAPGITESEKLNRPGKPCIVVSASGMATGGRVLHHLKHQLPNPRNSVVLTGYQVPGTRGRALLDGEKQVKIHGRYIPVRAEIHVANAYSAHADAEQMVQWLSAMKPPETAYVVHGEEDAARALAERLADELGWNAVVPRYLERVRL